MMLRTAYQLAGLISVLIILLSCGKDSACFKGTGNITMEQRVITSEVTSIKTEDNIDIVITQSNEASLIVEGGANLLPYINTEISGNQLLISSDNKCSMFRDYSIPITLYLSIPNLTKIDYTGQGNISSTNRLNLPVLDIESSGGTGSFNLHLDVDELSLRQHSGPADFTFIGEVNKSYIYTLGNGWFSLKDLVTNQVHVSHNGSGDIIVNAKNDLRIELRSTGNISYYGDPKVNLTVHSGSGQLIKK